ncbi:MAG: NTP transferase domain-containing protein [Acetobacteraceae bacterium]|nr:NTP transferase domain-containing protein [Acetobacteraceae bacterium]
MSKIVAFLPAKGTSERTPNKNVALLDGKPLVLRMAERLLRCPSITEVWLDTESETVFRLCQHLPVRWLRRDPALASNATDGHALFANEVAQVEADIYVQALCTSPFLKPDTIEAAIAAVRDGPHDSCVAIRREKLYRWEEGAPAYGRGRIPNSVDLPANDIEAMSLYVVEGHAARRAGRRFGDRPFLMPIAPIEAVDVNTPEELELAHLIAAGQRERERVALRSLPALLSSSMLSDTLDEMSIPGVARGLKPNRSRARIAGRANTLALRPLEPGEDFHGIYDALRSYDTVVPGDVILVQNKLPDFAYFGDLNARIAMRQGAVGAVVDGATRDFNNVRALDFPVFARGLSAADVRGRATVESMGRPITIGGVPAAPGDFVFADADGVCIVPQAREAEVLRRCLARNDNEGRIAHDIAQGDDLRRILAARGEF